MPEVHVRLDSDAAYRDALPQGAVRGRGCALNPGNRFEDVRLHVLGDHLDEVRRESPDGTQVPTRIMPDASRSVINKVDSPDLPFTWTVNPYRGCEHGCIYCYARPGHEYLSLSSGLDFETVIHAKHNAPELLRDALMHPSWRPETIVFSGVTDAYQPVERELCITRRCLEVCREFRQPVSVITKSSLITRDIDLLADLARDNAAAAAISLTSLDPSLASKMEPRAASPSSRLTTIRRLADAGIPVTVMTAPIVPRINDHEIPSLLSAARNAGASHAGYVLLKLPYQVKTLFLEWLQRHFPDRAAHVETLIRETRGGALYEPGFFTRQRGEGPFAEQIRATFDLFARRYHLDSPRVPLSSAAFRRPGSQLSLFGS